MLILQNPGGERTRVRSMGGFSLVPKETTVEVMRLITAMDDAKTPAHKRPIIEIGSDNQIRLVPQR